MTSQKLNFYESMGSVCKWMLYLLSLNYWLTKFIQEPKRYTRMCVEYDVTSRSRMSKLDLNPLNASYKKCS